MIGSDANCFLSDYEEPEQKYINQKKFESNRQKRSEINDLINKESRIKHGAINLLKVCCNDQTERNLRLEIAFSESNIKYLKDQLAEINCDLTLVKMKSTNTYKFNRQKFIYNRLDCQSNHTDSIASYSSSSSTSLHNLNSPGSRTIKQLIYSNNGNESSQSDLFVSELIPISIPTTINNSLSFSPSSSSSKSTPIHSAGFNTPLITNKSRSNHMYSLDEFLTKTADIMIYVNLKETSSSVNFGEGFRNFILSHYRENPNLFDEQIKKFNFFRQSSILLCSEPSEKSLTRLFEYYKCLNIVEKRFFQNSQCNQIHFTWYDSINGVESTQKSIQFEKASILFNCSALYSQLAAICCDISDQKLDDQMTYWLKAAGSVNYLNTNFSNSPSLDMSPFMLYLFYDIFLSQAYEIKAKMLLMTKNELDVYDIKHRFVSFVNCSKIYAHVAQIYEQISNKLSSNLPIKNYLPEIWYFLIKVKSLYCSGLSHYFAGLALTISELENISNLEQVQAKFDSLHDRTRIKSINVPITNLNEQTTINSPKNYFQKLFHDQQLLYSSKILGNKKRILLAKSHLRESTILQEEAIRQHSFCRKFSKDDYLHNILQHYHET
ncbi:rhophilin-2 isoform X2 [Brachionus plicatilis]|uniref:Rhophilin-2 isoform X2 n=1 Tax=Brachionus plicatilis TaxID=10195 RepID=A0A3M7S9S7_BRAPC|nr:rhophilin-2 isoform X2 [Brachionus plicatilis]